MHYLHTLIRIGESSTALYLTVYLKFKDPSCTADEHPMHSMLYLTKQAYLRPMYVQCTCTSHVPCMHSIVYSMTIGIIISLN